MTNLILIWIYGNSISFLFEFYENSISILGIIILKKARYIGIFRRFFAFQNLNGRRFPWFLQLTEVLGFGGARLHASVAYGGDQPARSIVAWNLSFFAPA